LNKGRWGRVSEVWEMLIAVGGAGQELRCQREELSMGHFRTRGRSRAPVAHKGGAQLPGGTGKGEPWVAGDTEAMEPASRGKVEGGCRGDMCLAGIPVSSREASTAAVLQTEALLRQDGCKGHQRSWH
jgi:hypothetical protein